MNNKDYVILFAVVSGGVFVALLAWSAIVKNQIQQTVATNPTLAGVGSLGNLLSQL